MPAVSQSYSSQIYTSVQNASTFPGDRTDADKHTSSESQSSNRSTDETVSLSPEGKKRSQNIPSQASGEEKNSQKDEVKRPDQQTLTVEEQKILQEMKVRDTEVRAHEQAHLSSAGQYAAGGASFTYQTGPDGKRYASGGEVPIDIAKEKTPEATIQKMRTVRRAALAPASPSAADRNIAAQASAKEAQAMKEILEQAEESAATQLASESNPTQAAEGSESDSPTDTTEQNSQPPQVSEYNRQVMTSAYEAIAALAD